MKFRGYGLPLNELISEGNIGLIQSLNRFDPSKVSDSPHMQCGGLEHPYKNLYYILGLLVKIGTTAAQRSSF